MDLFQELIAGFIEGLVAPLLEWIASIMLSVTILVQNSLPQSSQNIPYFIPLTIFLFFLMNMVESFFIGFGKAPYAITYCIGAAVGLYLFAPAILTSYPDAVGTSIGIIVIVIIGILVKLYAISQRSD